MATGGGFWVAAGDGDLGFSAAQRTENIRHASEVAKLFFEAGHVVLCTFVSPYAEDRARVRALFPEGSFTEVHVSAPLEVLRQRDVKGLYAKERAASGVAMSGSSAPFEVPAAAELTLDTAKRSVEDCVAELLAQVQEAAPKR